MSNEEIELKFFEINVDEIEKKILELGAVKKFESDSTSIFFNNKDLEVEFMDTDSKALRLRSLDNKSYLTFKGPKKKSKFKIRDEIEIEVSDFDKTADILRNLGFESTKSFSKLRKHYELGNIHFEIDELKDIPPYLEIETHSIDDMERICEQLDLDIEKGDSRTMMEIWPDRFKET